MLLEEVFDWLVFLRWLFVILVDIVLCDVHTEVLEFPDVHLHELFDDLEDAGELLSLLAQGFEGSLVIAYSLIIIF